MKKIITFYYSLNCKYKLFEIFIKKSLKKIKTKKNNENKIIRKNQKENINKCLNGIENIKK